MANASPPAKNARLEQPVSSPFVLSVEVPEPFFQIKKIIRPQRLAIDQVWPPSHRGEYSLKANRMIRRHLWRSENYPNTRAVIRGAKLSFDPKSPHAQTDFILKIQFSELDEELLNKLLDAVRQEACDSVPADGTIDSKSDGKGSSRIEQARIDELIRFANDKMKGKQQQLVLYLINSGGASALDAVKKHLNWPKGTSGDGQFESCQIEVNKKLKRQRLKVNRVNNIGTDGVVLVLTVARKEDLRR